MNNEYENVKQDLEEDRTVKNLNFHSKQAADVVTDSEMPHAGGDSQNQPDAEDLAMNTIVSSGDTLNSVDRINFADQTAKNHNTNPLDQEKEDKWQMPEPVFQVSSGKKVEKSSPSMPGSNAPADRFETFKPKNAPAGIQPQPFVSEEFSIGNAAADRELPVKVKSRAEKIIFIAAGILAMILFTVSFLIGVYFLFFR